MMRSDKLFNEKSSPLIERLAEIVSSTFVVDSNEQFAEIPSNIFVDLADIGIWIDPIDGTQQYIYGRDGILDEKTGITRDGLPTAMVLIGCFHLHNGKALIGLINRAFDKKVDSMWKSSIYWAADLPNGQFHNLHQSHSKSLQSTIVYGSVNTKVFSSILPEWNKIEVSACGSSHLRYFVRINTNIFFALFI